MCSEIHSKFGMGYNFTYQVVLLEVLPLAKLNTNIGKPSLRETYVYFPKYANAIFMQQKLKDIISTNLGGMYIWYL